MEIVNERKLITKRKKIKRRISREEMIANRLLGFYMQILSLKLTTIYSRLFMPIDRRHLRRTPFIFLQIRLYY